MGTNFYLRCITHEPHIESDQEMCQHVWEAPEIFEALRDRENLIRAWNYVYEHFDAEFGNTVHARVGQFLRWHPDCEVIVIDEYNKIYPEPERKSEMSKKMKRFRVRPRGGVAYTFIAEFLDVQDMRRRFGKDVHMAWIPNQKQHIVRRGKKLVAVVTELEER